jgi:hypothetical protein
MSPSTELFQLHTCSNNSFSINQDTFWNHLTSVLGLSYLTSECWAGSSLAFQRLTPSLQEAWVLKLPAEATLSTSVFQARAILSAGWGW